jgi:hypothetical protein
VGFGTGSAVESESTCSYSITFRRTSFRNAADDGAIPAVLLSFVIADQEASPLSQV